MVVKGDDEIGVEVRCSTDLTIRKCNKYLGTFSVLIGWLYCKSCHKKNYYQVVTEQGLQKAKTL